MNEYSTCKSLKDRPTPNPWAFILRSDLASRDLGEPWHNPREAIVRTTCQSYYTATIHCGLQKTHRKVQTQRRSTTNRPVFYLAEHHLPLGMIGSVDWFCPCVVRASRAEAATQLYWDASRLGADAAQSQVKQTVAKLRTNRGPFLPTIASYVGVKKAFFISLMKVWHGIFSLYLLCSTVNCVQCLFISQ